jgi:murein DD-endopeptidase
MNATPTRMLHWLLAATLPPVLAACTVNAPALPPPAAVWTPPPGMGVFLAVEEMGPIIPVPAEGSHHLFYELRLTNFDPRVVELDSLEVLDAQSRTGVLARYGADELREMIEHPGRPASGDVHIAPGSHAVVFLWVDLGSDKLPTRVEHRLLLRAGMGPERLTHRLTMDPLPVSTEPAVVIAPPLLGGPWYAHAGPANASHHRRLFAPRDGTYTIDTRFGSDWVLLREDVTRSGDVVYVGPDWAATLGSQVLSVAPGRVVTVVDGIPDDPIGPMRPDEVIDWRTLGGNRITVAIGEGRFAWYHHLRPGSLTVQPGDSVTRGQVLGLVGNSGNSAAPHLHFEINDSETIGKGEGLPFVFDCFDLVARAETMPGWGALMNADAARPLWDPPLRPRPGADRRRTNEIPLGGAVVVFRNASPDGESGGCAMIPTNRR